MKDYLKKILGLGVIGTSNGPDNDAWVIERIKEIPDGWRILDAGAGECEFKKYCSNLNYVSQDFAKYNGKGNNVGIQMGEWDNSNIDIVSDITSIPEPDGSFDAILCTSVFEHIADPISAVKEFSRLLKKGGILILTAPFTSMTHFAPYHFSTGFNRYFFEEILPRYGLSISEIKMNGNFFDATAEKIYILPEITKRYTTASYTLLDRIISVLVLIWLSRFAKKDIGSNELLAFRVYLRAVKK
ncbi:MAG: Type 11 methyltransferase [Parcubacteria group bacterium GW2011_GWA1_44_13]|uniref:Type 11 methyltransferase n=1 Tax=Candidatus Nomurabacteria bacterium GW2011_GWB1_44_12 TaxID=1618748 RepID=A0A837IAQ7_9BACT|nr:MAG: Type 11 methyltransferase [Candidatus Nomurabacteria bacterium GW2011_GWD1_44_10]KKT37080.1 MAG: Type 11 methyltransferase [Candidatus Nomurabacteria bacterium GW2011_GWB1_44_12]KKT38376.1 MAG: Type 11 methyltransferase [Parcubacteria group bacterium GW2011_GWA1_44_13]KKT60608.1 MAG: Methyltransferase type 11 [Parcubacteria group bacterium GW2011_GWC1_44_26]